MLTGRLSSVHFFVHILGHEHFFVLSKKIYNYDWRKLRFRTRHTSSVKYRVYNEMYARTRTVSKGCVRKSAHTVKSPNKPTVAVIDLLTNNQLRFYCLQMHPQHAHRTVRFLPWHLDA